METPKCIHCSSEYTYELSDTSFGCSECGNEFTLEEIEAAGKFIIPRYKAKCFKNQI